MSYKRIKFMTCQSLNEAIFCSFLGSVFFLYLPEHMAQTNKNSCHTFQTATARFTLIGQRTAQAGIYFEDRAARVPLLSPQ